MDLLSSFMILVVHGILTKADDTATRTLYIERNKQATLPCKVNNAAYIDIVQWFQGTTILTSGVRVVVYRNRLSIDQPAPGEWNLVINRVDESFASTYTCKTSTEISLSSIKLIIETPPKIDEKASTPEHTEFVEHTNARLECKVSGEPPPEITWYRGETEAEIGIKGDVLIIPNIERYAAGEFTCLAKNKHGEAERRMSVDVKFGPEVSVMHSTVYAGSGEEVVLACMIQAYPWPKAYWTNHKGEPVVSNWKYEIIEEKEEDHFPVKFTVLRIRPSIFNYHDQGEYKCTAIGDSKNQSAAVNLKNGSSA